MKINQTYELSMVVDTNRFQRVFDRAYHKAGYLDELDDEYIDTSLVAEGITTVYRDSRYKKKIRLLVNAALIVDDPSNTDKLLRKLDKRIAEYFNHTYSLDDFTLSGASYVLDISVGSRASVANYLKVIKRIGKVKGFSPISYDCFDGEASFCLSGNSNATDFLLYDLEQAVIGQLRSANAGRKKMESASMQAKGILRAEVRLTKPKAIRGYTDATDVSGQIVELTKGNVDVFMDTFVRVVPFGDFVKKDMAMEIIRSEVTDSIVRRRMIRLVALIPEKKSLHLAQKELNCRDVDKVMEAFTKIHLSPITIAKRHEVKHLNNLYAYFLK